MTKTGKERDVVSELAFITGHMLGIVSTLKEDKTAQAYFLARKYALVDLKRLESELRLLAKTFYESPR